ncbi:hypothetical protein DL96DRAFT_103854 [Flagelloscypha sp. PMI_526]|nr:hypothetical protein DL96DRAFT_103854 [Flagelloscypha sp. PMI_526]
MTRTTTIAYRDNRLAHVEEQSDSCYNMASCTSPEELGVFIARSLARNPVDSLLASSCSVDLALTYRALTKNTSSAPLANVDPIAFAEQLQDVSQVASHAMANHLTILRLSEIVLTSDIEWYTRATEHGVAAQKKTQQAHDEWRAAFKVKYGFGLLFLGI